MTTPFRSERIDVLLVDDDTELSNAIVSYFVKAGLSVRAASSGSAAFKLVGQAEPRVAILDYYLPDLNWSGYRLPASRVVADPADRLDVGGRS